jgi:hypothetical protein
VTHSTLRPGRGRRLGLGRRLSVAAALAVSTVAGVALVKVEGPSRVPAANPHFACVAVANAVGICIGPPTAD